MLTVLSLPFNREVLRLRTAGAKQSEKVAMIRAAVQAASAPSYFDWQLRQQRRAMARKVGK